MITPAMNEPELFRELFSEEYELKEAIDRYLPKFRRLVLKALHFPVAPPALRYTSPKKNKWLILVSAQNKKEYGAKAFTAIVCYSDVDGHGYRAYLLSGGGGVVGKRLLSIYSPHFFSRYAERTGVPLHGVDLIEHYFRENEMCACAFRQPGAHEYLSLEKELLAKEVFGSKREDELETYGCTATGIAMGIITKHGNLFFRTFITYEMAKGLQIETFIEKEQIRKRIAPKMRPGYKAKEQYLNDSDDQPKILKVL